MKVQFLLGLPFIMQLQNYNEFRHPLRWHDYFSFMIHEFPILLVRRYDYDVNGDWESNYLIQILGVRIK